MNKSERAMREKKILMALDWQVPDSKAKYNVSQSKWHSG